MTAPTPERESARSALDQLLDFYRLEVAEQDYDGLACETWENAVASGCLVKVPGGFDPERDDDNGYGLEPGDDWYATSPEIVAALEDIKPEGGRR